jgi:hypothetical protein
LIPWAFDLRKKICHRKSASPVTMGEGFVAATAGFMANWGPKVTQLAPLTSLDLKPEPVTMTDPSRHPGHRSAHPGAAPSMSNTSTEQGGSWRKQLVAGDGATWAHGSRRASARLAVETVCRARGTVYARATPW